ncbi:MAG TPA: nucleotidyl transferase AbiEii/AbiGii toxin family protein [Gammaproteobacteria bacterium]|nr:nucleotidyl transferase AbiEii/AbiGii toxin family protein [Gammaproteobacteria bacterium]
MSNTFKPVMSVLPTAQQQLWPELGAASDLGLVLYGGTAIALRLGHRASVDFDFFTDQHLSRSALRAAFSFLPRAEVLQDQPETLTVVAPSAEQTVKISFFGSIGFGRVGTPELTDDRAVQVASLDDLMATKLKVVLQRVEAKDYRDIAAMIRADVSLARGLAAARCLYGSEFQPSESLKALTYFEGGDLNVLSNDDKETLIAAASAVRDLPPVKTIASQLGV